MKLNLETVKKNIRHTSDINKIQFSTNAYTSESRVWKKRLRLRAFKRSSSRIFSCIAVLVLWLFLGNKGWTACGSSSDIAVPVLQRIAIPEASPTLPLAASLGLAFSYNVTIDIPIYLAVAEHILGTYPVV